MTLIRITSVTHAFNPNQRLSVLSFTPGPGALDIVAPANANIAPPGHYLLFIVDDNGVPSIGSIVQLVAGAPAPPPATLTGLSPSSAAAGAPGFTLTVNGTGFVSGASVRWNGATRPTTFVNSAQLTAAIPASDIAAAGTAQVTVVNPGAVASNALPFTVTALPAPPPPPATLTGLSPGGATAGAPGFTLTVNGTGLVSGASVRWNGAARPTTFVNSAQLTAAIPASDIAAAGTAQVTVVNPGAVASNALPFTVTALPAPPATFTLSVSKTGPGTVTSSPPGINCGSDCSESYAEGTVVTLTATPNKNFRFLGWGGAASGIGPCTVPMNAAKSVTATFKK